MGAPPRDLFAVHKHALTCTALAVITVLGVWWILPPHNNPIIVGVALTELTFVAAGIFGACWYARDMRSSFESTRQYARNELSAHYPMFLRFMAVQCALGLAYCVIIGPHLT